MAILGDKIDNVPGIPGIGEVTAAALVRHFGTVEEMLRRPEEIPAAVSRGGEKVKEKIVTSAERIRKNRQLVALRCDLVLPFAPATFARRRPDEARVRALFSELEFSRLLKDLPAPPPTPRSERAELVLDAGSSPPPWRRSRRPRPSASAPCSPDPRRAPSRWWASRWRAAGARSTCRCATGTSARRRSSPPRPWPTRCAR